MFVGLTIMFGAIILVDSIKEHSPRNKILMKQAEIKGQEIFKESMEKVQQETEERIKLWENSGLPPSMWKI